MAEAGLETGEAWVENGEFDEDEAYRATFRLLDNCLGVTAIFCSSDLMAIGVLRALKERGLKVPEDIIGHRLLMIYLWPGTLTED